MLSVGPRKTLVCSAHMLRKSNSADFNLFELCCLGSVFCFHSFSKSARVCVCPRLCVSAEGTHTQCSAGTRACASHLMLTSPECVDVICGLYFVVRTEDTHASSHWHRVVWCADSEFCSPNYCCVVGIGVLLHLFLTCDLCVTTPLSLLSVHRVSEMSLARLNIWNSLWFKKKKKCRWLFPCVALCQHVHRVTHQPSHQDCWVRCLHAKSPSAREDRET